MFIYSIPIAECLEIRDKDIIRSAAQKMNISFLIYMCTYICTATVNIAVLNTVARYSCGY